jgi:branched-chain amino acid transport system permease protein
MFDIANVGTNILILGAMYILVALGFAFIFNILGVINFAHGAVYMIGGYIGFVIARSLGAPPWAALLITTALLAGFGVFLERYCLRPFMKDFNNIVMVGVAITIIFQTIVNIVAGNKVFTVPPLINGIFKSGPFAISYGRLLTFAIGIILVIIVVWFVNRTKSGLQMQAVAQNMEGAALQGVNIHVVSTIACILGCGLAALSGYLMGSYLSLTPFMGDYMLVKVLILVILAGAGSIGGIIITGFVLGALNAILPILINGAAADAIAVGIVVVLLLVRPKGFFGHELT